MFWFNGQNGVYLKNYRPSQIFPAVQPEFGPTIGSLDASGNGMLAWHSAYPATSINDPVRTLYTQNFSNFLPIAKAQNRGPLQPIGISLDSNKNGWLLTSDKKPRSTNNQELTDNIHIQAHKIESSDLKSNSITIFEMKNPQTVVIDGSIDNEGNGFVLWSKRNDGILGSSLMMQSFTDFKTTGSPSELSKKSRDQLIWYHQQNGAGVFGWLEYENPDKPYILYLRSFKKIILVTPHIKSF